MARMQQLASLCTTYPGALGASPTPHRDMLTSPWHGPACLLGRILALLDIYTTTNGRAARHPASALADLWRATAMTR